MTKNNLLRSAGLLMAAGTLSLAQPALAEINISGWLNEGLTYYDDGESSDVVQVSDNGTTLGSRINLSGSTELPGSGLTAGFEVIVEPLSVNTPLIFSNQNGFDNTNGHALGVLGNSIHVAGSFGKITVGLQSMPTDNIAVLADPSLTLWSGISPVFRGNGFFLQNGTAGVDDGLGVWGDFMECLTTPGLQGAGGIGIDCNGIYRNGIRYDLPAFNDKISIAVGYANDDIYDIGMKYNDQLAGMNVILHIGYALNQGPTTGAYAEAENLQIQAGLMDPVTGLFGTIAYQMEKADGAANGYGDDTNAFYFKGGIKRAFTSIGDTAIYGEYGMYSDQYGDLGITAGITGSEVERIGFSIDQYFGSKLILYGKFENLSLDVDGTNAYNNVDDLRTFTTGLTLFF